MSLEYQLLMVEYKPFLRGNQMNEEEARLKFWDAVDCLREWIEYGPDSKKEVIEELEDEL